MKLGKRISDYRFNPLGRLRLKPMKIEKDKFPGRIRASTIASYWWCAWKSYATAVLGMTIPEKEWMSLGTRLHDTLFETLGKRFAWEAEFIKQINEQREDKIGFLRKFETGTKIFVDLTGHPDDFQVTPDNEVAIIEYKTSRMPLYLIKRFLLPVAKFQARIYPYVLEPTLEQLGYTMYHKHAVQIHSSKDLSMLHYKIVDYNSAHVERDILDIFDYYKHPEKMVPCAKWKCKYCSKTYKAVCPHYEKATK